MADAALTRGQAEFVERQRVGALATIFADGTPHVVPISAVLDVDRLVFATELDTQKVHNLKGDPHVALLEIGARHHGRRLVPRHRAPAARRW